MSCQGAMNESPYSGIMVTANLFLDLLCEIAGRFSLEIYAWVLMTNHYHILLKTNKSNLSRSMQWLGENEEIGNALGISYSAVNKSVSVIKKQIQKDAILKKEYEMLNSQFKM